MFQREFVEKISTRMFNHFFPRKSCLLWDKMDRYYRTGQATDDNMAHAHYMLCKQGCKRTLRICNTSTATVVSRTHLSVTLYVHYLSC